MKRVILTESDLRYMVESVVNRLIREGITYKSNGNGTIDASINNLQTDKANKEVDTRIWGSKNDVLYGDGTLGKRSKSISQRLAG